MQKYSANIISDNFQEWKIF